MATRATLVAQVRRLCGNNQALPTAEVEGILASDNLEILDANSWTQRKSWTVVPTVAPATITVGVTNGSSTVTSASFTAAMEGRLLVVGSDSQAYRIGTVVAGVSATLTDSDGNALEYAGTTDTDASAKVFKYLYRVSTTCDRIVGATSNTAMQEMSPPLLFYLDPELTTTADPPYAWFHAERDTSGYLQIGFFPPPSAAVGIRVDFLKGAEMDDDADTTLYPSVLLKWMAAESAAAFLLARTGDAAWASLADRYNKRFQAAFDAAKAEDLLRSSAPTTISSEEMPMLGSDEFSIAHDTWKP